MLSETVRQIRASISLLIVFTILTGFIYPGVVTIISQLICPWRANGSLLQQNNHIVGSEFIGQSFTEDKYFWGRPSATTPYPYNAINSSGSNLGPSNPDFISAVQARVAVIKKADPKIMNLVPIDLVTASGSGLDPDISPLAAYFQISRIAKARNISENQIKSIVDNLIVKRRIGILGESSVNVLKLNLALDSLSKG